MLQVSAADDSCWIICERCDCDDFCVFHRSSRWLDDDASLSLNTNAAFTEQTSVIHRLSISSCVLTPSARSQLQLAASETLQCSPRETSWNLTNESRMFLLFNKGADVLRFVPCAVCSVTPALLAHNNGWFTADERC